MVCICLSVHDLSITGVPATTASQNSSRYIKPAANTIPLVSANSRIIHPDEDSSLVSS